MRRLRRLIDVATERRRFRRSKHDWNASATEADDTQGPDTVAEQAHQGPDVDALEAELRRSRLRLRFTPEVERAYERETRARRNLRVGVCNVLAIIAHLTITARDAIAMPEVASTLVPLSFWVTLFVVTASSLIVWRRHSAPSWMIESVCAIGVLMAVAYVAISTHDAAADVKISIRSAGIFLLFLQTCLAARLQFRHSAVLCVVGLVAYIVAAHSHDAVQALVVAGNIRLLVNTMAFTLPANYVLEHRERRVFLLRALDHHRRRALTQDAATLQRLSLRDSVTGIANRRRFDAAYAAAWSTAIERAEPIAVLQVDVDFFKRYNDLYGHPAGDACLKRVAEVLHRLAQQHDSLAARTGGEEFSLLLPQCSLDAAASIGQAVVDAVRALRLSHADSAAAACVTVSIGVASVTPGVGQSAQDLLSASDGAMYDAKRGGRDRVACATSRPAAAAPESASLPAAAPSPSPVSPEETPLVRELTDRIAALTAAQDHGLHWLRFPPAIEAAYRHGRSQRGGRWFRAYSVAGVLVTMGYVWLSQPLFADVADSVVPGMFVVGMLLLPVLMMMHRLPSDHLRQTVVSLTAAALCIVEVVLLSPSRLITVYSYALTLYLVPAFIAVIAAQPFRYSLVTSVVIWSFAMAVLPPATAAWRLVRIDALTVLGVGIVLSLIGGYLIDLGARRDYLLRRIAEAQRALLLDNAATLRLLAESDPLTGLANRRKFDAEKAAMLKTCAAAGEPLSLLIVDIDHFKRYNDLYGHPQGDACLRRVAEALSQAPDTGMVSTAGDHLVARLGGEEFGVLVPGCDTQRALQLGNALCSHVRQLVIPHLDSPLAAHVTVSIGVASIRPAEREVPGALLREADAALYRAKGAGRDRAGA